MFIVRYVGKSLIDTHDGKNMLNLYVYICVK